MAFALLCLLFTVTYFASSQSIAPSLKRIQYKTGPNHGGDAETFTIIVNWNGVNFFCSSNPNTPNKVYFCDNLSSETGISNPSIEYYATLDWSQGSSALQISELIITDDVGSTYTITRFCVGSLLQHTLDIAENSDASTLDDCNQWKSKKSYANIHLGGDSKFTLLYVDIPIFGTRFANKAVEGGVRPPGLQKIGIVTGDAGVTDTIIVSVQWDIVLYKCAILSPHTQFTSYDCTLSETVFCPGIPTDFWISLFNPNTGFDILPIERITLEDETTTTYTFGHFCDVSDALSTEQCPSNTAYFDVESIPVGSSYHKNLLPFFAYDALYDYPDTISTEHVEVATDTTFAHGWDTTQNQYGGTVTPQCPVTPKPTTDPTRNPTSDPTVQPTTDPTVAPTAAPTYNPTSAPSFAPTNAPTAAPTFSPTETPSSAPTNAPSSLPTSAPSFPPTQAPTDYPTLPPTFKPTVDPTSDPSVDPTNNPTFLPTHVPTQEPTTYEPTFTRNPTEEPTEIVSTLDETQKPILESGGWIRWIAKYWIYIPAAIGVWCLFICLVINCAFGRNKKREKQDQTSMHVQEGYGDGQAGFLSTTNAASLHVICDGDGEQFDDYRQQMNYIKQFENPGDQLEYGDEDEDDEIVRDVNTMILSDNEHHEVSTQKVRYMVDDHDADQNNLRVSDIAMVPPVVTGLMVNRMNEENCALSGDGDAYEVFLNTDTTQRVQLPKNTVTKRGLL